MTRATNSARISVLKIIKKVILEYTNGNNFNNNIVIIKFMRQPQYLITKLLMTDDYNDSRVQQEETEKAGGELQKV